MRSVRTNNRFAGPRVPGTVLAVVFAVVFAVAGAGFGWGQEGAEAAHQAQARRFMRGRTGGAGARGGNQDQAVAGVEPRDMGLSAAWRSVGPAQIASLKYGLVTGRVTSVAIDPGDATGNTVYLGTTGGGVWKSVNAAGAAASVSFVPLTDTLPVFSSGAGSTAVASLSIGAVSVQPGGGAGAAVLAAGTGDPNDATDSYYGSGILRSVDGGNTWTLATGSDDGVGGKHSFTGLGTAGFAWSTASPSLVVAALSQAAEGVEVNAVDATNSVMGLYFSSDAGATWKMATLMDGSQVEQTPLPTGGDDGGNAATAVVWNAVRQRFYAAIRFHGVYQSADGMTWTRLANQPGTGLSLANCPTSLGPGSVGCPFFRGALAVQAGTGDMFALSVDRNNVDQGLWQDVCAMAGTSCANASVAWATRIASGVLEVGSGNTAIAQGDYDLSLGAGALDAADTLLLVGTVDLYRCVFANGSGSGCLLRNTTNALNGCAALAQVAPAQHAIALLAPLVYVGNDGGVWRSTDGVGETGTACSAGDAGHFQDLNGGLGSLAETVGLAAHPTDASTLVIGVGANGTASTSAVGGAWGQLAAGEGGMVAIDQGAPANVYISTGPGVSIAHCSKGAGCAAADFAGLPGVGEAQVANDVALVDAPFLLDPAVQAELLVGTCRAWRGAADGSGWSSGNELSAAFGGAKNASCSAANSLVRSLGAGGPVSAATAAVNAGSTVIYAGQAGTIDGGGTAGGHVFGTAAGGTDGGATVWTDLAGTNVTNDAADGGRFNPGGFDVSAVVVDSHDATGKTVYATVMGFAGNGLNAPHVYRSVDGGAHWVNISGNLPNAPVNALAVDPNDANTVYLGSDTGVYVTTQVGGCATGNCWSVYGAGLPNAPVTELVASAEVATGDGRVGELRAGTYGRGVWQVPLLTAYAPANPGMMVAPGSLTFAAQAVSTQSAAQTVTVTDSGNTVVTISGVTASGDFIETDTCVAAPLAPGGSCAVQVRFLPAATGARAGVLTVFGNVPGGQATVALSGMGTTAASIVLNPIAANFATTDIGSASAVVNVTISNTGGTATALQGIAIAGDFRISANTCGASLPPQTGCTVSVVFQPTVSGARTGTLTVTDDVGVQTTSLAGVGTAPATDALSPGSLLFGAQVLGTVSAGQNVTLTNAGEDALTLVSATITSGDFTAVSHCGSSLIGHGSCTVTVAYVPRSVGAGAGVLTVADEFRTQTVALSGTGLAPAGVSLSPLAGLTFGVTAVGVVSPAQAVVLTNNGGVALAVSSITIGGSFQVVAGSNTCGTSLAPGSSCGLTVVFAPAAGGVQGGSLVFVDSAGNSPQSLTLTGTGVDFSLAASGPTTVTVASGTPAVFPFLLSSVVGTPGVAKFTCLGAPANTTCTVTPAAPALGATTVVIVTVGTGVATMGSVRVPGGIVWLALGVPLLGLGRRRWWRAGMFGLVLMGIMGCGAGRLIPSTGTGGGGGTSTGVVTASGSYSIAVSATSAGLTRTVNVTLIVQ